jgi:glycerol-3-phosphate acyltransferase PlsX
MDPPVQAVEKSHFLTAFALVVTTKAKKFSLQGKMQNNDPKRVFLDVHGGDLAPDSNLEGALLASEKTKSTIVLVGDESLIKDRLKSLGVDENTLSRFEFHDCKEVIGMAESPSMAIRKKQNSSLVQCCKEAAKNKDFSAALSAGNSGAMMAASLLAFKRIPGVDRPAIAVLYPTVDKDVLLLDMGANVDIKSIHLVQFAYMGHVYMKLLENRESPRIGILSNGEESSKGTDTTRLAYQSMSELKDLNFKGYAEGRDIFTSEFDVIVMDGFTGNIVLKATEGLAKTIMAFLKEKASESVQTKLGLMIAKNTFKELKKKTDYRERGAAPLLGIDGNAFISHGSSDKITICNAILVADQSIETNLRQTLVNSLGQFE